MTTRYRILVVDDEPGVRRVLARALAQGGYDVVLASSGEEACELLDEQPVDAVLMDLRMPTMSGQTLFHAIRSQWPHLAHRTVVMSGDPEAPDHEEWLALHDVPVVIKPFALGDIVQTVQHLLAPDRRRANDAN